MNEAIGSSVHRVIGLFGDLAIVPLGGLVMARETRKSKLENATCVLATESRVSNFELRFSMARWADEPI
jgi:hypothetical protein